jgi:hypothetical protein
MKYCRWCGHPMLLKHTGLYDDCTGEKIIEPRCVNFWCSHNAGMAQLYGALFVVAIAAIGTFAYVMLNK